MLARTSRLSPALWSATDRWRALDHLCLLAGTLARSRRAACRAAPEGDGLDVTERDTHEIAQPQVTDPTAGFDPELLTITRPQAEQDLRSREAPLHHLPGIRGCGTVRRLFDAEVFGPQEAEGMPG
jgi:hypothetical protein